jgi:exopolyphosphatase / guanosine-5'-triphosphate,3'-diphosphate pyrophosphatase
VRYFCQSKLLIIMSLHTLAAVDLGSNSFHLQIARIVDETLYPLDSLKETVRLGAGVTPDKNIDPKTAERAFATLRLFSERLRGMPKNHVRVVGTNALRIAKNAHEFILEAEAILGFPIEIIAGREEARLIYLGVAKSLPPANHDRLVVDIGGGSTEFIIGHRLKPKQMDSLYMGCVSYSTRYFPDGLVDKKSFKDAQLAARKEIEQIRATFLKEGWREAFGSSGTAKALAGIIIENGFSQNAITREGLEWLRDKALRAGNFRDLGLGIKADRVPVMAGGLAIMLTIFEELDIRQMMPVDTALRDGVLHDMLGRANQADMPDVRSATVEQFAKRYHTDHKQIERVSGLAMHFFQTATATALNPNETANMQASQQRLLWAAQLHEIGMAIAQAGFHKHSAYILANADMPGFSKREQTVLARIVLAQRGKLSKVTAETPLSDDFVIETMCLRLSVLLSRSRRSVPAKLFSLTRDADKSMVLTVDATWLAAHDLTDYELAQEMAEWKALSVNLALKKSI